MSSDFDNDDVESLRNRLEEAEETLRAIRNGEVDALVVNGPNGDRVFTLHGADHPYRELIESMQQGAATVSVAAVILYCNRRFAEMVSRPIERVIGASVTEFLPRAHRAEFLEALDRGRTTGHHGEFEFEFDNGDRLPVLVAISSLIVNDELSICMIVSDLTEQRERMSLQEANRRKDEFLAMLAHELRNPLAPIRNALYVLKHSGDDPSYSEKVQGLMERQVSHLARLIDDLMDVSRITSGKIELRKEIVELSTVVHRAVEAARPMMDAKNHELSVSLPIQTIRLNADPTRLEQILGNLLTNAAKYSDTGAEIHLAARLDGDTVVITLTDSGIGIAPEKLPHIFDLFVQVERRLDRSQGGLGLGLSLVKSLTELHGGSVAAWSDGLGKGSQFIIRLPVFRTPATSVKPTQQVDGFSVDGVGLPRRRVLIVDDNVDSAKSIGLLLSEVWQQDTLVCFGGEEALEKALAFKPHVVLLDIGLPGLSGYKVAELLRLRTEGDQPLIVAMTGWGQEEDLRRSREAGFDHHLVKPLDLNTLQKLLRDIPPHQGVSANTQS